MPDTVAKPAVIPPLTSDALLEKTRTAWWLLAELHLAYIDMEDRFRLVRAKMSVAEILERYDAELGPCPWAVLPARPAPAKGGPAE